MVSLLVKNKITVGTFPGLKHVHRIRRRVNMKKKKQDTTDYEMKQQKRYTADIELLTLY